MLVINLLGQRDFLLYYCTMSRIAVVEKFDPCATIFLTYPRQLGVRSRCRRFLNQLETWVRVSPVFLAKAFFSSGVGYRLSLYVSFNEFRDFSLKQYTVSSPSQILRGRGNFRRSRYLSTAPARKYIHKRNVQLHWPQFKTGLIKDKSALEKFHSSFFWGPLVTRFVSTIAMILLLTVLQLF